MFSTSPRINGGKIITRNSRWLDFCGWWQHSLFFGGRNLGMRFDLGVISCFLRMLLQPTNFLIVQRAQSVDRTTRELRVFVSVTQMNMVKRQLVYQRHIATTGRFIGHA